MVERWVLWAVAAGALTAAGVWGRSTLRLLRAWRRLESVVATTGSGRSAERLAHSAFRKELHTTLLYLILGVGLGLASITDHPALHVPLLLLLVPAGVSLRYGRQFLHDAGLAEEQAMLERRYEEVLAQKDLAPRRWSERLAPGDLPNIEGFEVGRVYESGEGAMAGDFYDLYPTASSRLAAVIGDVTGHGIEASITAFQVKYLLRVFLRQYRDPGQAIEELNTVLSELGRPEEYVSLCAAVFDTAAGSLRFASAGHPAAWLWHDGEVLPLRSTGPLLTMDPKGTYFSREVHLEPGDLLLLYTDGLAEARQGEQLFGEDRIASFLRRDPGQDAEVLCKSLLEAARDFASRPLADDVAILAVRRT